MKTRREHVGRFFTCGFLFLLCAPLLVQGQATPCCNLPGVNPRPPANPMQANMIPQTSTYNPFPTYDPVTHTPPNTGTWQNGGTGNPITSWNQSPNPYSRPTPDQTRWFVESNPSLQSLDLATRENIINGTTLPFLTSSPYLPNGMSNPFYQNGPNWFVPATWSPGMNWQGVEPSGFLPATRIAAYSPSSVTAYIPWLYNPGNPINAPAQSRPLISTTSPKIGALNSQVTTTDSASVRSTLESVQRTLSLHETAGDKVAQVFDHAEIARIFVEADDPRKALAEIATAQSIAGPVSDPKLEVQLLQTRASANIALGEFDAAIETNKEAMERFRVLDDEQGEAETYVSSGWAFESLGNVPRALACYESALYLFSKLGNKEGKSRVLIATGSLYQSMGEFQKAAENYQQAFPSASDEQQARIYASLAEMNLATGNTWLALDGFKEAVPLAQYGNDFTLQGSLLAGIGRCHMALGLFAEAQNDFDQARAMMASTGNIAGQAGVTASIGELNYWIAITEVMIDKKKYFKNALQEYNQALPMMLAANDRAGEIGILTDIGLVFDAQGKYREALDYYLQALAKMEELQTSARLEEFRVDIAGQASKLYQRAVVLEAHLKQMEQAFNLSERARARLFLDQLGNHRINKWLTPEFVEQETRLRRENTRLERRLGQELAKPGAELNSTEVLALESQLSGLRGQYAENLRELKLQNPEYATFLTVSPLTLREAQSKIPADVTVVSYFTTPSITLAFVISRSSFNVVQLRVSEAQLAWATTIFHDFAGERENPPSLTLLDNWLIAPIKSELKTSKVAIVPYGVLHDVPFAALSRDGKDYLGDEHTLFMLPSVSVLPFISQRTKSVGQHMLVIANDESAGLPRLSHAYDEATEIASLYNTRAVLGDAAAATLFAKTAGDYDLVHLIAHIENDGRDPDNVRVILGSGDHNNVVALDVQQVLGMELRKTDLVVLSGCQSEVGKRTRGDDILGLSRAFIYAGSPSVLASLWNVDDEATKLLMVSFYNHLREGLSKADSLRAAQIELRQKYPHPYYWAGFVLSGDPGSSQFSSFLAKAHGE